MCSFSGATCTSRDVTMQITFLTRKSALIYRRDLRQRVASLTLNCNGVLAIRAYIVQFKENVVMLSLKRFVDCLKNGIQLRFVNVPNRVPKTSQIAKLHWPNDGSHWLQ